MSAVVLGLILSLAAGQSSAETRTLRLYFGHTGEHTTVTFKKNGKYIQSGLKELNRFLRDWRRNEPTNMDPRLFDLVWEIYQESGSKEEIHVVSAYRSPTTNAMLRKRSSGVAKKSQHMLGKAMDFYLPDVPLAKLRAIGMKFQVGGVGYYPTSGSPFVHMDVGSVRSWPRMSRKELVSLFPKGNTLHLPTDGKPLPGYDQALADYKKRVTSSSIQVAGGSRRGGGGNLFASASDGKSDRNSGNARQAQDSVQVASAAVVDDDEDNNDNNNGTDEEITLAFVPVPRPRPIIEATGVALAVVDDGAEGDDGNGAASSALRAGRLPVPILASATPADAGLGPTAQDGVGTLISSLATEPDAIKVASLRRPSAAVPVTSNLLASPETTAAAPGASVGGTELAFVPVPRGRPVRPGEEAGVEYASVASIPVPLSADRFRGPLEGGDNPEEPVVVALAPPTVDSDSYRPVLATATGSAMASKSGRTGRPRARPREDSGYSVNSAPTLTTELVTTNSLVRSRMVVSRSAFVAPHMLSEEMRTAPSMVHMSGFSPENSVASANRFSGVAVNFETVWKFPVTN